VAEKVHNQAIGVVTVTSGPAPLDRQGVGMPACRLLEAISIPVGQEYLHVNASR
jgi:hypothetical protein